MLNLRPSDVEILQVFALCVGPMTIAQFANWQGVAERNAARRLKQVHHGGWLEHRRGPVRMVPTDKPLYAAAPGAPEADWGSLAYRSKNRYQGVPSRHLSIYSASSKCYRTFGVRRRASLKPHHLSHDLALTSVFLRLLAAKPDVSSQWRPEDLYAASCEHGRKVPDVLLVDPETKLPIKGIDFLGPSYGADRLRDLSHEMLNIRKIPVELY